MNPYLDIASDFCQCDLSKSLTEEALKDIEPKLNQIFTYAFSCGVAKVFEDKGYKPIVIAGYSLGVYGALTSCGAISFEDGLAITEKAYLLMKDEVSRYNTTTNTEFSMSSIIGLSEEEIKEILNQKEFNTTYIVNSLSDTCKVLSGEESELERLREQANLKGAINTVKLDVNIPYHHPVYLKEASQSFKEFLEGINWKKPDYPMISSIDLSQLKNTEELIDFTYRNISTPINWEGVVKTISTLGIVNIIECGPGLTLSRNGRFIPTNTKYINIKNAKRRMEL